MMEEVILVDAKDEATGVMEKIKAHRDGLLHRAFSVFIFNSADEMLLQQRAENKYHSGGLWSNSCCSHPRPGEETATAALRRLKEEMGFETPLQKAFDFIYHASFENGLTEYEYDHVFTGYYDGDIHPDEKEVNGFAYHSLPVIEKMLAEHPGKFTAWFHIAFPKLMEWQQNKSRGYNQEY